MWNSLLYTLPDHQLGVVVLSNSAEAAEVNFQIATTILEQALAVKTGLDKPVVEAPEVISPSAGELLSYAGRYTADLGRMDIRVDGDDLYADLFGQSFKLLPHSKAFSVDDLAIIHDCHGGAWNVPSVHSLLYICGQLGQHIVVQRPQGQIWCLQLLGDPKLPQQVAGK